MSKEWMIMTLARVGFTKTEAHVFVYLGWEGPQKSKDIADSLKISRRKLYRILKKLRSIGIVEASSEYPARFSAMSFEKVLDLFLKNKIEQQEALQKSKEKLISTWRSITKKDTAKS